MVLPSGGWASCQQNMLPGDWGWKAGACSHAGCPAGSCWGVPCARWAVFWQAGDPDETFLSQAAQNLIVLAREEAGAEKIFQSDGVRLLTQLLDTVKADLMLAALRTLVGLCSGHRSRVGPAVAQLSCVMGPGPGEINAGEAAKRVRQGSVAGFCLGLAAALLSRGVLSCHLPGLSL